MLALRQLQASDRIRRVFRGVTANAADKVAVAVTQVLWLSVLPKAWGAEGFGLWLSLTAVASYLTLADFGFSIVAGNLMTKAVASGDAEKARVIFRTAWTATTLLSFTVLLIVCGLGCMSLAALGRLSIDLAVSGAAIAVIGVCVIQCSLYGAVYRSVGSYATSEMLRGSIGFAEGLAVAAVAFSGGSVMWAALAYAGVRLSGTAALAVAMRRRIPWATLGFATSNASVLKQMARPAAHAVTVSLAGSLAIQGVVLSLGLFGSAIAVALYGATRTIARLPLQASDLIGRAILPELALASAEGRRDRFVRLTVVNLGSTGAIVLPCCSILALYGPEIGARLSGSSLSYDALLFGIIVAGSGAAAFSTSLMHSLLAVNRQSMVSGFVLFFSIAQAVSPIALTLGGSLRTTAMLITAWNVAILAVTALAVRRVVTSLPATVDGPASETPPT